MRNFYKPLHWRNYSKGVIYVNANMAKFEVYLCSILHVVSIIGLMWIFANEHLVIFSLRSFIFLNCTLQNHFRHLSLDQIYIHWVFLTRLIEILIPLGELEFYPRGKMIKILSMLWASSMFGLEHGVSGSYSPIRRQEHASIFNRLRRTFYKTYFMWKIVK